MSISILDAVLITIGVIVIIKVTVRGFIAEFFSLAAFLVATAAGFWWYRLLALRLSIGGLSQTVLRLIAFFIIFIVVFIAVKLLQMLIAAIFQNEILSSLDHALGFFLGIFEAYIVTVIILAVLQLQPFVNTDDIIAHSIIVRTLAPFPINGGEFLPIFKNRL